MSSAYTAIRNDTSLCKKKNAKNTISKVKEKGKRKREREKGNGEGKTERKGKSSKME